MAELYDPEIQNMIELATTQAAVIYRALGRDAAYWDLHNQIVEMVSTLISEPATTDSINMGCLRVSRRHFDTSPDKYEDEFRVSFVLGDCWV